MSQFEGFVGGARRALADDYDGESAGKKPKIDLDDPSRIGSQFQAKMSSNYFKNARTGGKKRKAQPVRMSAGVAAIARVLEGNLRQKRMERQMADIGQPAMTALANELQASEDYRPMRMSGRGMYQGRGSFLSQVEAAGNRFLTKGLPRMVGAAKSIKGLMGRGMYGGRGAYGNVTMSDSSLSTPAISSAGDETGSICITNREYIGDIFGPTTTGTFDVTSFPLNPGLEQSFPWLSQLAANYEEYEFIQLVFDFKSSIQDVNSANGQVGTIISATNYNASQGVFTDKPSMSAYYGSASGKTTDDFNHGVECDPSKLSGAAGHYVRTNPVLVGEDLKGYDHGTFQLATHNIPTAMLNGTLGELFVYYKVMLRKPKFLTGRGLAITRALFVSGGSETTSLLMGTQALLLNGQQNNLKVLVTISTNNILLTFPAYFAGNVEIKFFVEGSGVTGVVTSAEASHTRGGNITYLRDIYAAGAAGDDTPSAIVAKSTDSGTVWVAHLSIQPATNADDNTFNILTAYTAGTVTQGMIDIAEYNSSFNKSVLGATPVAGISPGRPVLVNTAGVVVVPA